MVELAAPVEVDANLQSCLEVLRETEAFLEIARAELREGNFVAAEAMYKCAQETLVDGADPFGMQAAAERQIVAAAVRRKVEEELRTEWS